MHPAESYALQNEWLNAVIEYRKAYNEHPNNVEYKSRLMQTELKAADYYYKYGMMFAGEGKLDEAIGQFQKGLTAMPEHSKLLHALSSVMARKEADHLFIEGLRLQEAGKNDDAKRAFRQALNAFPEHTKSIEALARLHALQTRAAKQDRWAIDSNATITLNFRGTDLRTAFEFIAKSFNVNVIFDESIKGVPVTMFAKDVTFRQSLSLLTATTKTFYKRIGPNTIIVAPDKKDKRGQYEDHITRIFYLRSIKAKAMADILKGVMNIRKITVNEYLNSLVLRDTADVLSLAEKVIRNNDRKPAEVILEVEILEVNRSKADKLGLDLGTYEVTVGIPSATPVPLAGSIPTSIGTAANLTLPSATLRFFKQEIDAKTLANPRIRVISGEEAKIHIGDRVPLQASRIIDATGQVRTTFDYRDIGIRLKVTPTINLDNTINVRLSLEVSSLGENIGTANEPAFVIGTRNADSIMVLRDGETAILGGLIRDEDRNTKVKIPLLGDIPILGSLFTTYDTSGSRRDVLLTISPKIIRGLDLPPNEGRQFYSGTANRYLDRAVFAYKSGMNASDVPVVRTRPLSMLKSRSYTTTMSDAGGYIGVGTENDKSAISSPVLSFSQPVYNTMKDNEVKVSLVANNLDTKDGLSFDVLYNGDLLEFVRGDGSNVDASESGKGVIHVAVDAEPGRRKGVLAELALRPIQPGISYLVYKLAVPAGKEGKIQVKSSQVVIK